MQHPMAYALRLCSFGCVALCTVMVHCFKRLSWQKLQAKAATSSMLALCVASGICTDDFAQR